MSDGPMHSPKGQRVNPDLIKSWLTWCDHNHGSECNNPRPKENEPENMPMTFMDVIDECLVSGAPLNKYFALSYVWGRIDMHRTLISNKEERRRPRSLQNVPFPAVIRDAMALVRSLGERLLWVDVICMVQDDNEEMSRDLPLMDVIYSKAFATIVALHGEDAGAGLPGVQAGTREPQKIGRVRLSVDSPGLDHDPEQESEIVCLIATPQPLHLALEGSKWNSRGWIVQERLLSRRCLYFSTDAVYYQCAQHTLTEGGVNESFTACVFDKSPIQEDQVLLREGRINPLRGINALYDMEVGERIHKAFQIYKSLVELYSTREFSFKADVLRGFAGIFSVLEKNFHSKTYLGVPAIAFSHALLWTPAARIPRRGTRLPTPSNLHMGKPDSQFPSWSWSGWDGPVEYRVFNEIDDTIQLPQPMAKYDMPPEATADKLDSNSRTPQESQPADENIGKGNENGGTTIKSKKDNQETFNQPTQAGPSHDVTASSSANTPAPETRKIRLAVIPDASRGTNWTIAPPSALPPQEKWDPAPASTILTITAPTVSISSFRIRAEKEYLSHQSHVHIQSPQAVRRMYDGHGRHCGLWWEQAGYGYVGLSVGDDRGDGFALMGLSRYEDIYQRRNGPSRVEGEIPFFDENEFPATGRGSGLVNVLAVDVDWDSGLGHRCTVAVIHGASWRAAEPREMVVKLA